MGPYKCPDCGVWWAGPEHRCPPSTTTTGANITITPAAGCTCHPVIDWSKVYIGDPPPCPVHNYPTTITSFSRSQ
jgi:hypothetical protein